MHDPDLLFEASADRRFLRRRLWPIGMLSVAALLLHAVVLGGVDWAWPSSELPPLPSAAMQVRTLDAVAPMAPAPLRMASPVVPQRPKAAHVQPVAQRVADTAAAVAAIETPPIVLAQIAPAANASSTPASSPDEETVPRYDTRMPPALTLHYEMRRGALVGNGDLSWRPQGDRYDMKLEAKVAGLPVLTQSSTGTIDAAGIAPARYTDQRLRRSMTAANFQRGLPGGADKISFSGSSAEYPLRPGTQDRLSWMVQLAAVVSAEARLTEPGAHVVLFVVGANGDGSVWAFRCVGPEAVDTRSGAVDTIKYVREPREPYDTTIQVWLDPRQHDLPIRATQKSGPNDEGYELRLIEMNPLE